MTHQKTPGEVLIEALENENLVQDGRLVFSDASKLRNVADRLSLHSREFQLAVINHLREASRMRDGVYMTAIESPYGDDALINVSTDEQGVVRNIDMQIGDDLQVHLVNNNGPMDEKADVVAAQIVDLISILPTVLRKAEAPRHKDDMDTDMGTDNGIRGPRM